MELLFNISLNVIILLIFFHLVCTIMCTDKLDRSCQSTDALCILTLRLKPSMMVSENMLLDKNHYL
jgi:hypothetical protein